MKRIIQVTVMSLALSLMACGGGSSSSGSEADSNKKAGQNLQLTKTDWLQQHNNIRKKHQVPGLVWSSTLEKSAQNLVNTCPQDHSKTNYGENIFYSTRAVGADYVMNNFYEEEPMYNYNKPGYSSATGHFTQIVWKDTTKVGCAYKTNCGGKWKYIAVCHYDPSGNWKDEFDKNVFKPS